MTNVVLFHHAQGLTDGVQDFADQLRAAGHDVTVPDLYNGETFSTLDEGVGYAEQVGFDTMIERGRLAADGLPHDIVYGGFSLGVMPAQMLAPVEGAELFLYPGDRHLFVDSSLPAYDEAAATLLTQRVLTFLDGIG